MSSQEDEHEPSRGVMYGAYGIALLLAGAFSAAQADESAAFLWIGAGLVSAGFYATVAGAVARGIQLARP